MERSTQWCEEEAPHCRVFQLNGLLEPRMPCAWTELVQLSVKPVTWQRRRASGFGVLFLDSPSVAHGRNSTPLRSLLSAGSFDGAFINSRVPGYAAPRGV